MDYEKKYKEALEWMRSVYPTMQGADKEDAEHYFPELAESEDEKIRQLLIRFVKYDMSDNYSDDFTPADCIAWLEKQKPVAWNEEDEAMYYGVIETEQYMLDVVYGRKKFNIGNKSIKEECQKELDWLKSLRPHKQWKPTEEQMKAFLEDVWDKENMGQKVYNGLCELLTTL